MRLEDAMLGVTEVGTLLRLHRETVRRMIKEGTIPHEPKLGGRKGSVVVPADQLVATLEKGGMHAQAAAVRRYAVRIGEKAD